MKVTMIKTDHLSSEPKDKTTDTLSSEPSEKKTPDLCKVNQLTIATSSHKADTETLKAIKIKTDTSVTVGERMVLVI